MPNRALVPEQQVSANPPDSLKAFAAYIRTQRLKDFVTREIEIFSSMDLPLLKYLSEFSAEDIYNLTATLANRFLSALETDTYEGLMEDNLTRWEDEYEKIISKEQITLEDILLINSGQKLAMMDFIPDFTPDYKTAMALLKDLELVYQKSQSTAVTMITRAKKEEEQKLRETEERYRDLFDNASDLIHFVTPEGKILYVNNAWKNTLGYSEEELKGESLYFFVSSRDRDRFRAYRKKVIENDGPADIITVSFITKDNREVITEGLVSVKRKDGRPEYTRGIFRDVTRRVQNEEKLKFYTQQVLEREEKIKQLIQRAPDAIIVINEQGIINIWNPKAEQIFGWKSDEVLGMPLSEVIIPQQYREAHIQGMRRLLETGEARVLNKTIEVTALRKGGEEFYVSLTISRAMIPEGSLFIAFLRDISAEKNKELQLEKHRVELERTNQELEQYAWVASHDLKEPVRKIKTFSDMLLHMPATDVSEAARVRLRKIHDSAERMDKLIEAVLLYSRSSKDHSFELVNLNATVKDVLADLEVVIHEKNATVKADHLPSVEGIPYQLRQLFQNLLSNALKYSKPNIPPVVTIRAQEEQDRCRILVQDNGIGFKPEFARKIFQVFQRLVAKHEYEGTGIGLALCKKIVENHAGSIRAFSNEGEGATFEIILPLKATPTPGP